VPPVVDEEIDPSVDPLQVGFTEVYVVFNTVGSVTVAEVEAVQPFASVASKVYVPAVRFVAVRRFPPEGDQA
jgi:hypothetical protein